MNIILIGPPGAGKGTQTNYLVKKLNGYKVSTGEILREEIQCCRPKADVWMGAGRHVLTLSLIHI